MIFQFETDTVEVDDSDGDVLIIGFYTEDNYLMIQSAYQFDEQDVKLGMDTYHIERDDQSMGGYGGVEKCILEREKIVFILDEAGKQHLKCESVEIGFEADAETYTELVAKLGEVFAEILEVK